MPSLTDWSLGKPEALAAEASVLARYWQQRIRNAWKTRHKSPHYRQWLRHCIRQYRLWCDK